jgi:hypothetical protein
MKSYKRKWLGDKFIKAMLREKTIERHNWEIFVGVKIFPLFLPLSSFYILGQDMDNKV